MQNAAGGGASVESEDRNEGRKIAADLVVVIERVQTIVKLIETVIATEFRSEHQDIAANVVVLDDVTPRYIEAHAALDACGAGLRRTLHLLRDTTVPAGSGRSHPPVRLVARA